MPRICCRHQRCTIIVAPTNINCGWLWWVNVVPLVCSWTSPDCVVASRLGKPLPINLECTYGLDALMLPSLPALLDLYKRCLWRARTLGFGKRQATPWQHCSRGHFLKQLRCPSCHSTGWSLRCIQWSPQEPSTWSPPRWVCLSRTV